MKPTELRIGNLVAYKGLAYKVIGISTTHVLLMVDEIETISVDVENLEPIPITEGLLLKNGFKKDVDANNLYRFVKERCLFDVRLWNSGIIITLENYESDNVKKVHLPKTSSVHQLQNAYQLVTKEELTLQL
jgi:hypothetical protein